MTCSLGMNKELGTKWFTFYTKVRPWFACITLPAMLTDFAQYTNIYFSNWWLLLNFLAYLCSVGLSIAVAVKSTEAYDRFVSFVAGVLIFESIGLAYGQAVQLYIQSGFNLGYAVVNFIVTLVISYFLWYRLNLRYFRKRLIRAEETEGRSVLLWSETPNAVKTGGFSLSAIGEEPVQHGNWHICGQDLAVRDMGIPSAENTSGKASTKAEKINNEVCTQTKVLFCRKCGKKLIEDSLFCSSCGTKVIKE